MRAQDLTDEDIGRSFWVQVNGGAAGWQRICFEGFTRNPAEMRVNGGSIGVWMILLCPPSTAGVLHFRTTSREITGVLVRAADDVWPVQVDFAVTRDGEIVEIGERAA